MARDIELGSSQYLECSGSPVSGTPLTLACWANPETLGTYRVMLAVQHISANYNAYAIMHWDASDTIAAAHVYNDAASVATIASALSAGTWSHIAATFTSTTQRDIYCDGSTAQNTDSKTAVTPDHITVGVTVGNGSSYKFYFDGMIAEAGIWDVVLTQAEINQLEAGFCPLLVRPNSLVAYWPLIRDEDQDRVGGYHLTPVASPTVGIHPPRVKPWWLRPTSIGIPTPDLSIAVVATNPDYLIKGVKIVG